LDEIKDYNVLLRFSVDGAKAESHDYIRGEGNFEKTIQAMRLCKEKGIEIGLASTVCKSNFHEFLDIVALGKELGTKETELTEVIYKGNATFNKDLLLDQPQLEQLRVHNITTAINDLSFRKGMGFDKFNDDQFGNEDVTKEYCCNAGISLCFINAKGDVYPCTLFTDYKEFCGGNMREEKFTDIWTKSEAFNKIRSLKKCDVKSCVACEAYDHCTGGCRARAYAISGELDGPMEADFCTTTKNMCKRMESGESFLDK